MKRMLLTIATVSALGWCVVECAAQENTAGTQPTTTTSKIILREGTEISLKIAQNVNSRTARQDDVVEFVLAAPLKVGDTLVADVGSRAIGTVIHSVKPNFAGDPGELTVRLTFLKVGKVKVPIRGTTLRVGDFRVVIRGSQATIQQGTPTEAYVDADTPVEPISMPATPPRSPPNSELSPPVPAAEYASSPEKILLPNGKLVQLVLLEPLSSKTAKVGAPIKLHVLDDVKVGDTIVIAKRAAAAGTVIEAKAARRAWRKGDLVFRLDSVTLVTGQQQALQFLNQVSGPPTNAEVEWMDAMRQTQGLAMFALPFAPLQHGNQALLRRGTVLEAVTHGEVVLDRVALEAAQAQPAVVLNGPGTVTLYYPQFEAVHSAEIWCGDVKLGNLKRGRRIAFNLPAGEYRFHLQKKGTSTPLHVEGGQTQYLRLGFREPVPPYGNISALSPVAGEIAEVETVDTPLADHKDFRDIERIDLSLLQGVPGQR